MNKMFLKSLVIIFPLTFIVFFYSCMQKLPDKRNVIGKYFAKHNRGTEYIDIIDEMTYIHFFNDGIKEYRKEGKWNLKYNPRGLLYIHFEGWHDVAVLYEKIDVDKSRRTMGVTCPYVYPDVIEFNVDLEKYCFYREKEK